GATDPSGQLTYQPEIAAAPAGGGTPDGGVAVSDLAKVIVEGIVEGIVAGVVELGAGARMLYCALANCPSGPPVEEWDGGVVRASPLITPPPDSWGNDKDYLSANRFNRPHPTQSTGSGVTGAGAAAGGGSHPPVVQPTLPGFEPTPEEPPQPSSE